MDRVLESIRFATKFLDNPAYDACQFGPVSVLIPKIVDPSTLHSCEGEEEFG